MRHFIVLLLCLIQLHVLSQDCPTGILNFNNQQEFEDAMAAYPNCTRIDGIELRDSITDLSPLNNIEIINGSLLISRSTISEINLPNLEKVDIINIEFIESLTSFEAPLLKESTLIILYEVPLMTELNLPNLEQVTEISTDESIVHFILNKLISVPMISGIFPGSDILSRPNLVEVEMNSLKSLEFFSFVNKPALTSLQFNALESLNSVVIDDCPNLNNLELNSLKTINEFLYISSCASLVNFNMDQLTLIDGGLDIINNEQLSEFSLRLLGRINGLLNITNNPSLTTFKFERLREINGQLILKSNDILEDISGLALIQSSTISHLVGASTDLTITANLNLSICNIESICGVINDSNKISVIDGNAVGCNSPEEIDCDIVPSGDLQLIGNVFFDSNNNGMRESFERGIEILPLKNNQTNQFTFPDSEGNYGFSATNGSAHEIELLLDDNIKITTSPTTYSFTYEAGSTGYDSLDFGINFIDNPFIGEVTITSATTLCNNNDVNFFISYRHLMSDILAQESVVLELFIDPLTSYVDSDLEPLLIDDNRILFLLSDLRSFDKEVIELTLEMPDETAIGEILEFELRAYAANSENFGDAPILDIHKYESEVRCSYDPNDKQVNPIGLFDDNLTLIEDTLYYTIRFQNTGNFPAEKVEILDTLDMNLDLSTFRVLDASHTLETTVTEREISFLFDQIFLPDSISNEPESHGYVLYRIEPFSDIANNTVIENTAGIYFDFNPPIITNTTSNTMVDEFPTISSNEDITLNENRIFLIPNPANGQVKCVATDFRYLEIYDVVGQKIQTSESPIFNIDHVPPQVCVVLVYTSDGVISEKLIVR